MYSTDSKFSVNVQYFSHIKNMNGEILTIENLHLKEVNKYI